MPRRSAAMNGRMPPVTILEARLHRSPACEESFRDQSMRRPPRVTHEVVRALVARSVEMVLKVPQRHPIGRGHIAMSARGSSERATSLPEQVGGRQQLNWTIHKALLG
jgi:hypothetical protein